MPSDRPDQRRPTTIAEIEAIMARFRSAEALHRARGLAVRPSDVFVATYPKCGTTWVQQIVHQLRSGGSMDFDEISEVVPWLESAWDMGIDPAADQAWHPRAFKSHFSWHEVPKGGRYINVVRDPEDVVVSFYRFFEGWFFEPGSITLDEFGLEFFLGGTRSGRYWEHVTAWFPVRDQDNVLLLAYEEMVAKPREAVGVVADFLGYEDEGLIGIAHQQSTRKFMLEHPTKFDEHLTREARDEYWGLPPGGATTKVRPAGSPPVLSDELRKALAAAWAAEVTPLLGLASYAELRERLALR